MRKLWVKMVVVMSLMIFIINASHAQEMLQPNPMKLHLQTLDNYVVDVNLENDNKAQISQSFDIVNRYKEPIIPGRAKLVLVGDVKPTDVVISIGGSRKAVPDEDIIIEDGNNVVYYEIWRPVSKGERLNIDVVFNTELKTHGVLFKQLNLNFGEPEIHMESMALNINLPDGRHVTHTDPGISLKGESSVLIEIPKDMIKHYQEKPITVEYSSLPLPTLPFNGYWLWLVLIVMSAMIMVMRIVTKKQVEMASAQ